MIQPPSSPNLSWSVFQIKRLPCLTIVIMVATALSTTAGAEAAVLTGPVNNPVNNHNYYLLTQNNWTVSEAEAIGLGGHLATINDEAENGWVSSTFSNFGGVARALWIGLNDAAIEGTFVWASGWPVGYKNWAPGEPNNATGGVGEDWVHIFYSSDTAGRFPKWNDAPNLSNA